MVCGMVSACRGNQSRSTKEHHRETTPDRLAETYLLGPTYGLTRMALKLALCFSWVTFPIAIAVLGIFKEMARFCQPCTWLGAAFDGPGFTAAGTVGQ